jgi:predicted phosphoribosyltransferase
MPSTKTTSLHDLPELRDRAQVFRDRDHAGQVLARMLAGFRGSDALVLGIPSGGVPVAGTIAKALGLGLDVAVVSKILLPWTTEAGYGAVAFDGSTFVDARAAARFGLSGAEVDEGTERAREKVQRRVALFRGGRALDVAGRTVILVDDGVAAGSTLRAAIAALRARGVGRLVVAVPTGHGRSLADLVDAVDALYCANVRHGLSFAVADAYQAWRDVGEDEAVESLRIARQRASGADAPDRE